MDRQLKPLTEVFGGKPHLQALLHRKGGVVGSQYFRLLTNSQTGIKLKSKNAKRT